MWLVFRQLFEQVVRMCMQAGLIGGAGSAIDASVIEADASSAARSLLSLTCDGNGEVESSAVRRAEGGP
jgi:hypothetical protein